MKKSKSRFLKSKTSKVALISITIISIIFTAYLFGYIPICLSAKPPAGNYAIFDILSYEEEYPELSNLPNLDKITYQGYGTDATADVVYNEYKTNLVLEGYTIKYEGTGFIGSKNFQYIGLLKGITAVGIIISSDALEETGHETVILYMTGNGFDFIPILSWYQSNYEGNEFFDPYEPSNN